LAPSSRLKSFFISYEWQIVTIAALAAFGLGYAGFISVVKPEDLRAYLRCVTLTAHLFVLESNLGPREGLSWSLVIAQVLAPAVFGYAAVKAALAIFREELRTLCVPFWKDHVVICGLGQKGSRLVREYRRQGIRVVGIEADRECLGVAACNRQGGVSLVGNAANQAMLQRAGALRARQVIAVSGDDGANLEVGLELMRLSSTAAAHRRIGCFLHVSDTILLPLVQAHALLRDPHDFLDVRLFNTSQLAARLLFERHPLDYQPTTPGSGFTRVHLIVLGFGAVGESVALQAARVGVLATAGKTRISVVDNQAPARESAFLRKYPAFREVADLEFRRLDLRSADFVPQVQAWSSNTDELATVVVSVQDNSLALSTALPLSSALQDTGVPIRVRLDRLHGLAALLADGGGAQGAPITPFGMLDITCTPSVLEGKDVDFMARAFHEFYLEERRRTLQPGIADPVLVDWHKLDPGLQDSNRQLADHLRVKLRAVGCFAAPRGSGDGLPFEGFEPKEIELLSQMEHRRWVVERLLAGWRFAPGPRNLGTRTSPHLVEWQDLALEVKEQDAAAIRAIPHVLERIGQVVRREHPRI